MPQFQKEEIGQLRDLFDGMVRVAKEIKANAPEQKAKCELIEKFGQEVYTLLRNVSQRPDSN